MFNGTKAKPRVGVMGATGYAGEELTRLLSAHEGVELYCVCSHSYAGKRLAEVYPNYILSQMTLEPMDSPKLAECDIVFTALPHGQSMKEVPELLSKGVRVIDLSGDFRYNDVAVYEHWYGIKHAQGELLDEAVYGLCELYRESVRGARLVANPGCYTTTAILALYPLLLNNLIKKEDIIIDAKSGVSGAGRSEKLANSFCEVNESMKAYGIATHRHTSEIEQELSIAAKTPIQLCFTPHLVPFKRGILETIYAVPLENVTIEDIKKAYSIYSEESFVHVLPTGSVPEIKHVAGSNNCILGYQPDERLNKLIIVSCTDNLIKGAAGQAVQNMNIMLGLYEGMGLSSIAMYL